MLRQGEELRTRFGFFSRRGGGVSCRHQRLARRFTRLGASAMAVRRKLQWCQWPRLTLGGVVAACMAVFHVVGAGLSTVVPVARAPRSWRPVHGVPRLVDRGPSCIGARTWDGRRPGAVGLAATETPAPSPAQAAPAATEGTAPAATQETTFVPPRKRRPKTDIIKVSDETVMTTAGMLGALAGFATGGIWLGAALFAAFSYMAREAEDNDFSKALRGVAKGSISVLNFGAYVDDKYSVTDKVGEAFGSAAKSVKKEIPDAAPVMNVVEDVAGAVKGFDSSVGILETAGTLTTSASDLAASAVSMAVDAGSDAVEARELFEADMRKKAAKNDTK